MWPEEERNCGSSAIVVSTDRDQDSFSGVQDSPVSELGAPATPNSTTPANEDTASGKDDGEQSHDIPSSHSGDHDHNDERSQEGAVQSTGGCQLSVDRRLNCVANAQPEMSETVGTQTANKHDEEEESGETSLPINGPSRRSQRQFRAAWKSMSLPRDFENVFRDESDTDSDSSEDSFIAVSNDTSSWAKWVVSDSRPEDVVDDSPSRREWLRQKQEDNEENPYLDQLMSMIGLEEVKAYFLALKSKLRAGKLVDPSFGRHRLHLVLHGKDGTGKRTIAQLYTQFLFSIGAVKEERFCKMYYLNFSQLPAKRPTAVFYDDSDRIYDSGEVESILSNSGSSVAIVTSRNKYLVESIKESEDAMEQFQAPLSLPDYDENELMQILIRMMRKRNLLVEGGFEDNSLRAMIRRVARRRSSEDFANVHDLETELDKACRRRALRLQKEYTNWLTDCRADVLDKDCQEKEQCSLPGTTHAIDRPTVLTSADILGPEPKDIRLNSSSWEKLQAMIGLDKIKKECGNIIDYTQISHRRELLGLKPIPVTLNRLITGPSGVGKSTVARLYGQLVVDLGLINGEVMVRNPSHLVGSGAGESLEKTSEVLEEAQGNVLIIDDAHILYQGSSQGTNDSPGSYLAVIDALVAGVSADPEEDRCIILAGNDHQMEQLFNNSDPGLQRRFPKETALKFDGYSEDELCQILDFNLQKYGLEMTEDARTVSRQVLSRMRMNPKFGNAGGVENLVSQAIIHLYARIKSTSSYDSVNTQTFLEPADFDPEWDRASRAGASRATLFEGFVGFDRIINQFESYQNLVAGLRLHDIDPKSHVPWNFIFKGPPGTGKTSTARKVGQLYYDMGLLSTDEVVTCSVTDLIGEYLGHTGPKVRNTLETGLGKVLFIDEAYRLAIGSKNEGGSQFQAEAIGELVDAMTKPRYAGNMVVILAGYTAEMEILLRSNPGLRSRFPTHVMFPPMDPHSCLIHLKKEIKKLHIEILDPRDPGEEKKKQVHRLFAKLSRTRGWASGRDVETLAKSIVGKVYMQQGTLGKGEPSTYLSITTEVLIKFLQGMLRERKTRDEDEAEP